MIPVLLVFKNWALLFLRLSVGAIFLFRGWQKFKNFYPNGNLARTDSRFIRILGTVLILAEIFGGLLILLGIYTQIAALFFVLEMAAVAVWKIIKGHKFSGGPACAGRYEFELLLVSANLILATMGGGLLVFLF